MLPGLHNLGAFAKKCTITALYKHLAFTCIELRLNKIDTFPEGYLGNVDSVE